MITKNDPKAYAKLFEKATEVLNAKGSDPFKNRVISNIDEYFACLRELAEIEEKYPDDIDPIFTILPATEETFNIDANTRKISIPDNFAEYGVGVEGDEIAEILYFSIDRYFDAIDLAEMDIIIQWKHSADNSGNSNLSATYKKSLTLQPGKIVFGWPITSEITERSGNVQFSVRFYKQQNNTLVYSFSTATAVIKIQSGLNFVLDEEMLTLAINKNQKIIGNLVNSQNINTNYVIASPKYSNYCIFVDDSFEKAIDELTYDLPVTFAVKAEISNDTPEDEFVNALGLDYIWYDDKEKSKTSTFEYKKVTDETYNKNEIYYEKKDGKYEPYYVHNDDNPFDDGVELYVKYSVFTPENAGTYYTEVYNSSSTASQKATSKIWTVPGATEPSFKDIAQTTVRFDDENGVLVCIEPINNAPVGTLDLQWYNGDMAIENAVTDTYEVAEEGIYYIVATHTRNKDSKSSTSPTIAAWHKPSKFTVKLSNTGTTIKADVNYLDDVAYSDSLTYEWKKLNDSGDWESIGSTSNNEYEVTISGSYSCAVTNSYKEADLTIAASNNVTVFTN